MTGIRELFIREKLQYRVFFGLSIMVLVLTSVVYFLDNHVFQQLLGEINPLLAGFLIIALSFVLLSILLSKGWFAIYRRGNLKGYAYALGLAALFGAIAIIVDFSTRIYSADLNVLFPKSLLYYPAIGFYAETLFQVLPISIVLLGLTRGFKKLSCNKAIWISILVASLVEPLVQVTGLSGQLPPWFAVFESMRLFVFVLSQLSFFKRYDFVTMYWFRIVYYIFWHIVWGYLRLILLF